MTWGRGDPFGDFPLDQDQEVAEKGALLDEPQDDGGGDGVGEVGNHARTPLRRGPQAFDQRP